jgi:hypothetical protein
VSKGWSEAYGLFTQGEAPMVLSYTTSPAYHIIAEKTDKYAAAPFAEGHYMQVEVAGRIAGSPDSDLAGKFLAFMISPGFQDQIPTTNWMYPVIAPSAGLPEAFAQQSVPEPALLYGGGSGGRAQGLDRRVAGRDGQLMRPLWPGLAVLGAVGALIAAALSGMIAAAGDLNPASVLANPYYRGVIQFTLWQAALSTLLSIGFALPIARALARRGDFPGRALLLRLFMLRDRHADAGGDSAFSRVWPCRMV